MNPARWGVCIAFIAAVPFKRKEEWAWNCLAIAMSLWFVIDTFLSWRFGALRRARDLQRVDLPRGDGAIVNQPEVLPDP